MKRNFFKHSLLFCMSSLILTAADFYQNGNIYTVDSNFSKADSMVVDNGKIVFVGKEAEAKKYLKGNDRVINLEEKTVIPGIVESHMHFRGEGEKLLALDIFMKDKKTILEMVEFEAKKLKPGEWITGRGWNQEVWENPQFPSKEDLDKVAPNNPVSLTRACGHALWTNTLGLKEAGITLETKDPVGGEILKNSKGEPLGILTDTAMNMVRGKIPPLSNERKQEAMKLAQKNLFSLGITSASDAGANLEDISNYKALYDKGELDIKVYVMLGGAEVANQFYPNGPQPNLYNGKLNISALKLFADGSLGARSAWMLDDYSDRVGHKGNGRYSDEEIYQYVKDARKNGFIVATHAIGDAANRQTIEAYEKVLKEMPWDDHRFRIEHFQIVNLDDISKTINLGILPVMQAVHATSDMNMAEDRVGSERIKGAYAWRKIIDMGGKIANGSDAPVELVNPFYGIYASVARKDHNETPKNGWYPEESMTREEALKSFTIWSAFSEKKESIKGSLEPGKAADFIVLDRDIMVVPEKDIIDTNVLLTVLDGKEVYKK